MRRFVVPCALTALILFQAVPAQAAPDLTVADQLAAAKKAGRSVFLLVSQPGTKGVDELRAAVARAQQKAPATLLVEMDRTRADNRDIVKRYGLAGTRVPMVLVLAHNGAPGGGVMPGEKATKRMLALLPSPRKADTLLALFERKAAFVIVGTSTMAGRAAAVAACHKAAAALKKKATVIEVNLKDKAEQAFLDVLGADRKAKDVVVHVYGLSGRKTEALKAPVTSEALVTAAQKKQECCPGGKCG